MRTLQCNDRFDKFEESKKMDIYNNAHSRIEKILSSKDYWEIDRDRAKEIDDVINKAQEIL